MRLLLAVVLAALCVSSAPARADPDDPHAWMLPTGWTAAGIGAAADVTGLVLLVVESRQELASVRSFEAPTAAAQHGLIVGEALLTTGSTLLAGGFALVLSHYFLGHLGHHAALTPAPGGGAFSWSF
ncbi:MAG: hypothetical protein ACYCWW_07775 [Deltaproteobacteria bacterium]